MKGIYLSVSGLAIVNLSQFSVELGLLSNGSWLLWVKGIGFVLLVWGAILSYLQGLTKEVFFSKSDYDEHKGGYLIPYKKFKKYMPLIRTFEENEKGYEEVGVDVQYIGKDILIGSSTPFTGKVIIK